MTQEYAPTDSEVETAFHEYSSQVVKREKERVPDDGPMSYPPELEDWECGLVAYKRWLAAHDAGVAADALRLTDGELRAVAAEMLGVRNPRVFHVVGLRTALGRLADNREGASR